jgi:hypothetical protein
VRGFTISSSYSRSSEEHCVDATQFEVLQDSIEMRDMMMENASLAKYVGKTMQGLLDKAPMEATSSAVLEMVYDGPKKVQAQEDRTDTV